jgi:hypothetical protein
MLHFSLSFPSRDTLFGGASRTVAVKFKFMIEDLESLLASDAGLQLFNALTFKFHDFPADQAYEMIMVFARCPMLKTRHPVAKLARRGPPAFRHQLQRAVYSSVANPRIPLPNSLEELTHAQVRARFNKHPHNLIPLPGELQTSFL